MELTRLASPLNAYTSLPGGNGQAQSTAPQTARAGEGEAVSRTGEVQARQTGSTPAPESTRVSLSKQGVERAAAETQANQQATAVAAQAATGGVTAVAASTSLEAENPRSSVSSVQATSTASVRDTTAQNQAKSTTEQNTVTVEANRARNVADEAATTTRNDQQRAQMQRDQEYSRARARQDAPSFAQSGVSAYQGVANY